LFEEVDEGGVGPTGPDIVWLRVELVVQIGLRRRLRRDCVARKRAPDLVAESSESRSYSQGELGVRRAARECRVVLNVLAVLQVVRCGEVGVASRCGWESCDGG
jgi:hypothetical protein